jgi:hypothetical protein
MMMAVRKIRSYEGDFDPTVWVEEAMMVYKAAHTALAEGDEDKMHKVHSTAECNADRALLVRD